MRCLFVNHGDSCNRNDGDIGRNSNRKHDDDGIPGKRGKNAQTGDRTQDLRVISTTL